MSGNGLFKKVIDLSIWKKVRMVGAGGRRAGIGDFAFEGKSVKEDIVEKYSYRGDLLDIYTSGSEQLVHKWHHYIPIYDRYFSKWRNSPVRFLEIGVSEGGSLSMWRKYFGEQAIIFGIDIDRSCARSDGVHGQVRIGSQTDVDFLQSVVSEMGGVDIVLDDGSHVMEHIKRSLEFLFPQLNCGGVYMIEDLHAAYWIRFGGGINARGNFFNFIRELTDDMHSWYHLKKKQFPAVSDCCTGIHVHDSICVLEKGRVFRPTHSRITAK